MTKTIAWANRSADFADAFQDREFCTSQRATQSTWKERRDDLLSIRRFNDDWDGQGADAPSVELVDSALILALHMDQLRIPAPDRIVAGVTGTVILEWQTTDGQYTELEVTQPYVAEWFADGPNRHPRAATMDFPELKSTGV